MFVHHNMRRILFSSLFFSYLLFTLFYVGVVVCVRVCVCHILSCCRPVLSMAVKSPRGLLTSHVLIFRVSGSIASCYSLRPHDDKVETCVCLPQEMQQYAHMCEHPWTHRNKCTQFCKEHTYTCKHFFTLEFHPQGKN